MINILICDDNIEQAELIRTYINSYQNSNHNKYNTYFSINCTYSSKDALNYIETNHVDIAFLDIEIDETTGIELAKQLICKNNNILIIFETSYDSYAYLAYEINAFDYLLKPISMDKFIKTFDKVLKNIVENKFIKKYMIPKLKIKFKGEVSYISQRDILYIEKTGKKVTIHTKDTFYEYTISLKDLEDLLDKDLFLRCHSGFIIWLLSVVQSPAQHSGLRIQHCCSCGISHSSGLDSIPGLGTSICQGFGWGKKREKQTKKPEIVRFLSGKTSWDF